MDRRNFLATSMSTGIAAAAAPAMAAFAAETNVGGLSKATLPTPALIVDLDALEANIAKMAEHCRQAKCSFRPHAKTHKCPEIARRQIAAGAIGICAATVPEAEALVAAGIRGVLLTSPIVDTGKIARMIALASAGGSVMLSIGHPRQAALLAAAAEAAGVSLDVLVDLDVGDKRTGMHPGEPAVALAKEIAKFDRLTVRGVQAYAGHASHTVGFEERQRVSRVAIGKAVETKALLNKAGFDAKILSGGSTGTYNIDSEIDGMTELQVGSYVFMDVDYRRIGGQRGAAVYADFQPSLTVLTTVVSATHAERVTVDAGTKAVDTTTTHRPEPKGWPGLMYTRAGDEFGAITREDGGKLPSIGERIELIVPHCDPNVNLYDRLYACRGDQVEAIWPVAARRDSARRAVSRHERKAMLMAPALRISLTLLSVIAWLPQPAAGETPTVERNSIGMELVAIPAGDFAMGGQESAEALCAAFAAYDRMPTEFADEYPRHPVRITRPFLLGRHEVAVGQFRRFTEDAKYQTQAETDGQGGWGYDPTTGKCSGRHVQFNWRSPGFPQTDDHPVINVTWNDAAAFCDWLSKKEGRRYRLPSEAEWEYACRAGTSTRYFHGDDPAALSKFGHLLNAAEPTAYADVQDQRHDLQPGESLTAKVGGQRANAWGLFDMLGNTWEWTGDWYAEDFYARSPASDPRGPAEGTIRVRRGGAWNTFPLYARASYRNWNSPNTRCINVGFRVACER